jgi:hypothetical protein
MISVVSIALITVIGIVICFACICSATIFCCCAFSSFNVCWAFLCGALLFSKKRRTNYRSISHHGNTDENYENINSFSHRNGMNSSTPVTLDSDTVFAESYLVAPLADAIVMEQNIQLNRPFAYQETDVNSEQQMYPNVSFKDIWAATLFIIQVIVIIFLAVQTSLKSLKMVNPSGINFGGIRSVIAVCVITGSATTVIGTIFISIILRNAEYVIEGVMWISIVSYLIAAIACLTSLSIFPALILFGIAYLNYWYLNSVRSRIGFASAVLSVACKAIKDNYIGIIFVAYFMVFLQLLWFIVWSIASYGVYTDLLVTSGNGNDTNNDKYNDVQLPIAVLLLLSLNWGSEVMKSLLQTTANGVIACWWLQRNRKAAVKGALFRAMTTSFGSICFGALIVSSIQTLRGMLNMLSNKRRASDRENGRNRNPATFIIAEVASFLLKYVEQAMVYFNKYAFCYVAAYGMGFIESGKKVIQLFTDRGWTALINDNLVSNALIFALLGITGFSAIIGAFLSLFFSPSLMEVGIKNPLATLSFIGGLIGFAVASVLVSTLNHGVAMVFVCMAENPGALKVNYTYVYIYMEGSLFILNLCDYVLFYPIRTYLRELLSTLRCAFTTILFCKLEIPDEN